MRKKKKKAEEKKRGGWFSGWFGSGGKSKKEEQSGEASIKLKRFLEDLLWVPVSFHGHYRDYVQEFVKHNVFKKLETSHGVSS